MDFEEYLESIDNDRPSSRLSETLVSLWWDKKGNWDRAHSIAQDIPTKEGSAVHAYLHREEGDFRDRQHPTMSDQQTLKIIPF
jgi:hypothetical protein